MTPRVGANDERTPTLRLLRLDAVCWALARATRKTPLWRLWKDLQDVCVVDRRISLRWWAAVQQYAAERFGDSLFAPVAKN